jgi:phosphatidylglycerophosphatase C
VTTHVAAFDFDETLTERDTVVPFLRLISGDGKLAIGLLAKAHRLGPAVARRDRNAMRALATAQVFRDRAVAEVERRAVAYGEQLLERNLRDDTVARLQWHRAAGHRVVIVSASYEVYVRVVADRLGLDGVLATRLEVVDGRCTGRLVGENCRCPEKVRRLDAWLDAVGLDRGDVTLWAYGDSIGDRELLAAADRPHRVHRRLVPPEPPG